jgi:16S rRNA (adenine1518-N6/adenine1519-N6)-dimethyltransferase
MTYGNKTELLEMLRKNNLFAKKHLGQNFLISTQILNKIVETAELNKKDYVIEIGPGLGMLTNELVKLAGKVKASELDAALIPILQKNLNEFDNLEIVNEDALKMDLPKVPYKLVANIPYYITSPLLMHFLHTTKPEEKRADLIVLLVQKEVAQKICVGKNEHSVLSLQIQIFGKPEIAHYVPKTCFFPEPKVDSAILKIKTYEKPLVDDVEMFLKIIKTAFSQRRKTLLNSLKNGLGLTREQITKILETTGIGELTRPQELEIKDWQRLIAATNL